MVFPWVVRKKVFWKSISFGIKQIFFNIGMSLLSDLYTGDLSPNKKQVVQLNSLEPRKKPYYFPLYCLFNRDPYGGVL